MNEYWEITHARAVVTQAVWGMQPAFELNNLTLTQHGTLTDSLPTLAQTRDNKENGDGKGVRNPIMPIPSVNGS